MFIFIFSKSYWGEKQQNLNFDVKVVFETFAIYYSKSFKQMMKQRLIFILFTHVPFIPSIIKTACEQLIRSC